jgi:hypothetical protein
MAMDTKMIRIVSRGFVLSSRGRVMTPIMTPYRESINRIWSMLTVDRADIDEKLDDGTFVRLNIQNYDKDNSIKADVATGTPHKVIEPIAPPTPVPVEPEKKEEPEVPQYMSKRDKKKNKNRGNNQPQNQEPEAEEVSTEPEPEPEVVPEVASEAPVEEPAPAESLAVEAEEVQ